MRPSATRARHPRRFRFTTRRMLLAVALLAVMFSAYGWLYRRIIGRRRYSNRIEEKLDSLRLRRPADMTRGQWGSAVAWTLNLHGNSQVMFEADLPRIKAFCTRLEKKLEGQVDMSTIHWIWDEYAALTPHGASYQRFKPMMLDEIGEVGPQTDVWQMNVP